MLRMLLVALTAFSLTGPARAQGEADAIQGVISRQIEAFQADDFETAFSYASPTIRRLFGTSENFGAMVRNGYPMVWRPAEVQFKDVRGSGSLFHQRVLVRDGHGVYHLLEYQMIPGAEGWKINGVWMLEQPPMGV